MEHALEAFQNIRENLRLKNSRSDANSEFASEFSEDYNSISSTGESGVRKGILKARSKYVQDNLVIPPEILERIPNKEGFFSGKSSRAHDSGFNSELVSEQGSAVYGCHSSVYGSEQGSNVFGSEQISGGPSEHPSAVFGSELGSNYLENYGLNGPLEEYVPLPASPLPPPFPPSPIRHEPPPASVTSIATKKKKQQEAKQATIRQHYYPEGGWGWVILLCSLSVQVLSHGLQLSFGVLLLSIVKRWASVSVASACWAGSLCVCISSLMSPVTVATCRMKSTRLTAVVGGLITSLGILFTSFASQFHQIVISYGLIVGIGVGFVRDSSTLMVAQYFKRKRELVEVVVVSGSGLGVIIISRFLRHAMVEVGWRIGLQAVTGVFAVISILGIFYRSATLYHPQRRAILHLKSQKRKIKDKNKALEEKLPFFDFSSLSSRTFQIILLSTSLTSLGIFTPLILLVVQVEEEQLEGPDFAEVQTHIGGAWILGVLIFGILTLTSSRECHIGRQYLCQVALLSAAVSVLVFASLAKEAGFFIFVWFFGASAGGYHYSIKMFVFEKVRARNFARAWGFLQAAQALPVFIGVPITQYLNQGCESRSGFYFSGVCMLAGFLSMFLINIHKHRLRKLRHNRHKLRHTSVKSTSTKASEDSFSGSAMGGSASGQILPAPRRLSFTEEEEEEEDVLPEMVLLSNHELFNKIEEENNEELSIMSEEGLPGIDLQEQLLLGELCLLDNITSCDVVDNYLMLDEYEQNLIKEHEGGPEGLGKRIRKWSLVKQQCLTGSEQAGGGVRAVDPLARAVQINGRVGGGATFRPGDILGRSGDIVIRAVAVKDGLVKPVRSRAITTIHEDSAEAS